MLIKNARLNRRQVDLRLTERIVEIGEGLSGGDDLVIDALGSDVLPGLHDHHIHLNATAVAADSVSCANLGRDNEAQLQTLLRDAPGSGWIRGVAYHESMGGDLDRIALDRFCADRPVRIQHSSGKLWVLNTLASQQLQLEQNLDQEGIERDAFGRATGRLFRMDAWLRQTLARSVPPDLSALSVELASYGVTGVTDASYSNTADSAELYAQAQARGELKQRLYLMGDESLGQGPLKILLDEDDLPEIDTLVDRIRHAHEADRGAAFHCVSHVELLVALMALAESGTHDEDRIEHAGVVRDDILNQLVDSGCTVVTQPGFIVDRGERLRRQADDADQAFLYRYGLLQAAGVPVAASSDAPYGPINPWQIMSAAVARRTEIGTILGAAERTSTVAALRGYLSAPQRPGGAARELELGAPADLCILQGSLDQAFNNLLQTKIKHTIAAGQLIYSSGPNTSSVCSPR